MNITVAGADCRLAVSYNYYRHAHAAACRNVPRPGIPGLVHHRPRLSRSEVREGQASGPVWQRGTTAVCRSASQDQPARTLRN